MENIIKAFKDVQEKVVPDYKDRLNHADATIADGIAQGSYADNDIHISFFDAVLMRQLFVDMRAAVSMLDNLLTSTISNLETTNEMMNRKPGRPRKEEG